jgi:hypothetical protein
VLWLARLQPSGNPSGIVYGMIVASVVITAEVHYKAPRAQVIAATALTVGVYWLTHVYCHLLGETMRGTSRQIPWRSAPRTMAQEATVLWGGAIELLAVGVAYAVGAEAEQVDWAAIGVSIVLLFTWGLVIGVRNGARGSVVLLDALFGASLGALVAGLKLLLK